MGWRWLLSALTGVQTLALARAGYRVLTRQPGPEIGVHSEPVVTNGRVAIVVPVLNEQARLVPCLEGAIAQGDEVTEILVVDGGSSDGTRDIVAAFALRDARVHWLDASPVPLDWNGKAWNLQRGLESLQPGAQWVLMLDADVRPKPHLAGSLLHFAQAQGVDVLSVATQQLVSGVIEGMLHPAMLTTLVYRYGAPGRATWKVHDVQANGQCMLVRRDAWLEVGGMHMARSSVCEDVTLGRVFAAAGHTVGFYQAPGLVDVRMYSGWRDAWRNWPRSLPLRDRFTKWSSLLQLLELTLTQGLPMLLLAVLTLRPGSQSLRSVNLMLMGLRLGVLAGTARAYTRRPWSYWLSPLTDPLVMFALWRSTFRRRHFWRERPLPSSRLS